MIQHVVKTAFISLGIGYLAELVNSFLGSLFLHEFLKSNLVTILIALLAINATTMGIVLTKVREMVDKNGGGSCFQNTRSHMLLSIKEQIWLIVTSIIVLSVKDSEIVRSIDQLAFFMQVLLIGIFVYSLLVLYDTAKSVLIIIDFDN